MKLEDIDDVLKQNVSKDCCVRLLAARILHCDDYSKLYESCRNYDEFEKRVLNKECPLNGIYSTVSMYGKDRKNHWYRIRELFGNRCFKTASDAGSLLVGNEEFQVLIPNGYGDGTTRGINSFLRSYRKPFWQRTSSRLHIIIPRQIQNGDILIQMEVQATIGIIMKALQKIRNGSSIIRQTSQRMHKVLIL